jgi:hypothetical protein
MFFISQASAGSDFLGAFAFDEGLFSATADVTPGPEAAQQTPGGVNPPQDDGGLVPAFEDDDDGMFFGTPPGGMGDRNAAGGGGSDFSIGFGAAESTSVPPTTSMSKKLGNSGPFGGLFEKGGVFNRPASFVNQPAFFGGDSANFFTDKHLAGSEEHKGGQIEDVKAGNSFYRSGTLKPTLYDADSISAWMAGKVARPTLGRRGQRETKPFF